MGTSESLSFHCDSGLLSARAGGTQVEVLKLSWRCPWECWPAIPALRELHLTGRDIPLRQ